MVNAWANDAQPKSLSNIVDSLKTFKQQVQNKNEWVKEVKVRIDKGDAPNTANVLFNFNYHRLLLSFNNEFFKSSSRAFEMKFSLREYNAFKFKREFLFMNDVSELRES